MSIAAEGDFRTLILDLSWRKPGASGAFELELLRVSKAAAKEILHTYVIASDQKEECCKICGSDKTYKRRNSSVNVRNGC